MLEIERKWLIPAPPELNPSSRKAIIQGYLHIADKYSKIRLRQKGDLYFMTIKGPGELARAEFEIELNKTQFETLWPATLGHRLEKDRYEIYYNQYTIELDLFKNQLAGLIIAEVEFASIDQANSFIAPNWFGTEVTHDSRYKNRNLTKCEKIPDPI